MQKSTWTTISVLYWNQIQAIVPDLYKDRPSRLEDNMRQLVEAGLVNQVFPYRYVCHLPNFHWAFLALIEAPVFNLQAKQQASIQGQVSRIHIQKFSEAFRANWLIKGSYRLKIRSRIIWSGTPTDGG